MISGRKAARQDPLDSLLVELAAIYAAEGRPGGDQAAAALESARTMPFRSLTGGADPGILVKRACSQPGAMSAAGLVGRIWRQLHWGNWGETELDDAVSSSLFSTELVGPDGHFEHSGVRVGLLISAPATDYPLSSHSGEETYFVISGTAEWVVEGADYTPKKPGTFIYHPAWVAHGRRTLGETFLGAWRWSGDLDLASFRVADR